MTYKQAFEKNAGRDPYKQAVEDAADARLIAGFYGAGAGGAAGLLAGAIFGATSDKKRLRKAIRYALIGAGTGALVGNELARSHMPIDNNTVWRLDY